MIFLHRLVARMGSKLAVSSMHGPMGKPFLIPLFVFLVELFTPHIHGFVFASTVWLDTFFVQIQNVIDAAVPVLLLVAFLYFVWGMVIFIGSAGDERRQVTGRNQMFWGIIALFILSVVWGIIQLMQALLGVDAGTAPVAPRATVSVVEHVIFYI